MDKSKNISISDAQLLVDDWIKNNGVRYFSELTNMTILTEEVGELARLMARTYGDQSFKKSDLTNSIPDELADIFWVILCLSNQMEIDLTAAFKKNIEKKSLRDKLRHHKNEKL